MELPARFFATSCEPTIISESLKINNKGKGHQDFEKNKCPLDLSVTSIPPPLFLANHWVPAAISSLGRCCHPGASTPQTPLHSSCIPPFCLLLPVASALSRMSFSLLSVANSWGPLKALFKRGLLQAASLDLWGWAGAPSSRALVYQCPRWGVHDFWGAPFTAASGTAHRSPQRVSTSNSA